MHLWLVLQGIVQAILLFGSELWNLTPLALKYLEGFHIRAACWMTGMMSKKEAGTGNWTYPVSTTVLEKAALHTIGGYIQVRRQTITLFIVNRPIFDPCREGGGAIPK